MATIDSYTFIKNKIQSTRDSYPSLRGKSDDYVFSALCIKSNFYKNPSLTLEEGELSKMLVDGTKDGGVDAILTDPNSEESNLVLVQSKFYQTISLEEVKNAVLKMITFYRDMQTGHYENVSSAVQKRFLSLNAEVGDESKIVFVFYTSASKNGIRNDRIQRVFSDTLNNSSQFELKLYYGDDIQEEIKECDSRRPTVENGKIAIDEANNYLAYGEDAVFVNASAFSIKQLYAEHSLNLLSRNLRYHIAGRDIDKAIEQTIRETPETFWFKNNGLTVICDDFSVDGREVKLKNFSIVNGGQTTYMIHKSREISSEKDLFIPCKIIKVIGETEDEKNLFSLEIAKATNSQKAIKKVDLKSNSPEQVRFSRAMHDAGIFYQTKRGETIPLAFKNDYQNSDLSEVGKLCLAGIFQLPATSRNKPSLLYNPEYYDLVFDGDQNQIAGLVKEMLYIDSYFRGSFLKKFDDAFANDLYAEVLIPFAHNARTCCIAFVVLASRFKAGNITKETLRTLFSAYTDISPSGVNYTNFKNIAGYNRVFPAALFSDKDKYDAVLYDLFVAFIKAGRKVFSTEHDHDQTLNETNFLKKDSSYYLILKREWDDLSETIDSIYSSRIENE